MGGQRRDKSSRPDAMLDVSEGYEDSLYVNGVNKSSTNTRQNYLLYHYLYKEKKDNFKYKQKEHLPNLFNFQ